MVLTLPGAVLALGRNLDAPFPEALRTPTDAELEALLARFEPAAARARRLRRRGLGAAHPADALHRPPLPRLPRASRRSARRRSPRRSSSASARASSPRASSSAGRGRHGAPCPDGARPTRPRSRATARMSVPSQALTGSRMSGSWPPTLLAISQITNQTKVMRRRYAAHDEPQRYAARIGLREVRSRDRRAARLGLQRPPEQEARDRGEDREQDEEAEARDADDRQHEDDDRRDGQAAGGQRRGSRRAARACGASTPPPGRRSGWLIR